MPSKKICNQFAENGFCTFLDCKYSHTTSLHSGNEAELQSFFEEYTDDGFYYDPSRPAWNEFRRLSHFLDWDKEKKDEKRSLFKDALVQAFNNIYGTEENDLESWHTLCRALDITPLPDGLNASREAVRNTYVNLVDLVDLHYSGEQLRHFNSELELSEYTKKYGKIFPRENAYAGGLLKYLLRHIVNPSSSSATRTGRRRRSRRWCLSLESAVFLANDGYEIQLHSSNKMF